MAPRPSPLHPSRKKARPATHRTAEKERQLTDGRGGEGVGEEPNYMTASRPNPRKSFNTLWYNSNSNKIKLEI